MTKVGLGTSPVAGGQVSTHAEYGSGIRRAKKAMEVNGSPKLVFSPNNDTDDYTLAVAYVNEEFARIQKEEETKNVPEKLSPAVQRLLGGYSRKKRTKALALVKVISVDSHVIIEKMEQEIGATDRTVKRYLKEFQDAGALKRVCSDTSGEWILL